MTVQHTLAPVYDEQSRVLILGTIPSPKSRETKFYYGHPQNAFWRVLAAVFCADIPEDADGKKNFLLSRRLALWDVLRSCEITGAADSTIKNPVVNDFSDIFKKSDIKAVFTTGTTATRLYRVHCPELMPPICLPSTSPANRRFGFERLVAAYSEIKRFV